MKVLSKQRNVSFIFCSDPITIDKRKSWGESNDNLQIATNGAFLKMKTPFEVSHLVQPNEDKTAPVGWVSVGDGLYNKLPIHIIRKVEAGEIVELNTLDGKITYECKELSAIVCNDCNGSPDENDCWIQSWENIIKNYEV